MPAGSAAVKERHQPLVLVDTAGLSEEEWLAYRRKGIGGSDVAALLGISPWRTARDLFYDKLNIAVVEDHEDNWVALEMGHLLEPLVAKIFQHQTGYKIYQIKKMFQHPEYLWMLADVDYFVELPDGSTAILEIKTTNYNAKDNWWLNGEETIPAYYECQGRHYMAVMDVDRCFFCCLYGNNAQECIIRDMRRDLAYEDEMIFLEQDFWENHVLTRTPPPYTEDGDLVIESVRRYTGPADKEAPAVTLDLSLTAKLMRFLQLQEQKKGAEAGNKKIEEDMKRLKAAIIAKMGKSCKAICQQDGVNYTVTYNPIRTPGVAYVKHIEREQERKCHLYMTYGFLIKENPHRYVYCAELRCRESDPLAVRLDTLRAFREHLAQYGGRIEQSVECELDGNYRPVKVRKNYETADLSRPVVVWLYTA